MIISAIIFTIVFFLMLAAALFLDTKVKALRKEKEGLEAARKAIINMDSQLVIQRHIQDIVPITATYKLNMFEADEAAKRIDLEAEVKKVLLEDLKKELEPHVVYIKEPDLRYCDYRWKAVVKVLAPEGTRTEFGTFYPG